MAEVVEERAGQAAMNDPKNMSDDQLADFLFPRRGLLPSFVRFYHGQQDIVDTFQQVLTSADSVGTFRELSAMSPELMERAYQALCKPSEYCSDEDKEFSFFAGAPTVTCRDNENRLQAFGSRVLWHHDGNGLQGPTASCYDKQGKSRYFSWTDMESCPVRDLNIPVNVPYPEYRGTVRPDGSRRKNFRVRSIYMTAVDFVVAITEAGGNIIYVPPSIHDCSKILTLSSFIREAGGRFVTIEHSPYAYNPYDDGEGVLLRGPWT